MKKSKKILAFVLAMLITVSMVPLSGAMAHGTKTIWSDSFEDGLSKWSLYDGDDDGNDWMVKTYDISYGYFAQDGEAFLYSESKTIWGESLAPDNLVISEPINVAIDYPSMRINWYIASHDLTGIGEHYSVYVVDADDYVDGDDNENHEKFYNEIAAANPVYTETLEENTRSFFARSADITEAVADLFEKNDAEKNIRLVFRHHDSTDKSAIKLDNVSVEAFYKVDELANYTFEDGMDGWTTIDMDGDGRNWEHKTKADYFDGANASSGCIASTSYDGGNIKPENYVISPAIEISGKYSDYLLSWYVGSNNVYYYQDHYSVYVYSGDKELTKDNISSLVGTALYSETLSKSEYQLCSVEVDSFVGQTVRIIFLHHASEGQDWLKIDNVSLQAIDKTKVVDSMEASGIVAPKIGETPAADCSVTLRADGGTVEHTEVNLKWQKKVGDNYADLAAGEAFASGQSYRTLITVTVDEGYMFTDSMDTCTVNANPAAMVSKDESLRTATFAYDWPAIYLATWLVDGEETKTETYTVGDAVTKPADPTKEGYTFNGWNDYNGFMPAKDVTFTAKWTANTYTVVYNPNAEGVTGTMVSSDFTYDTSATLTKNGFTRDGYTFCGWATSAGSNTIEYGDGASIKNLTSVNRGEVTLYAVWSKNTYTLTYDSNGGENAPEQQTGNTTYTVSDAKPVRVGYTFRGWAASADATTAEYEAGNTITLTGNTTLYAIWEEITYTITYNANGGKFAGGEDTVNATWKFNDNVTVSSDEPVKAGSEFKGWATSADATTAEYKAGASIALTESVTLYAVWEEITFTLKYDANGGEFAEGNEPAQQTGSTTYTVSDAEPVRVGYTFLGWSREEAAKTATYKAGSLITLAADQILFAVWTKNPVTATFDYDIDKVDNYTVVYGYGDTVTMPADPSKTGHTFDGWFTAPEGGEKVTTATITADTIYYAQWTINSYEMAWELAGGNYKDDYEPTEAFEYASRVTAPAAENLEKTGHEFKGWSYTPALGERGTMPACNVTATAQWSINSYKVTWDANGGNFAEDKTSVETSFEYNTKVILPDEPTREGYIFGGWFTAPEGGDGVTTETITADTTYYAQWEKIETSEISWELNGGAWVDGVTQPTLNDDGTVTMPGSNMVSKDGAVLMGWQLGSDTYEPGENVSVTGNFAAVWGHTVTWKNGETTIYEETYAVGEEIAQTVDLNSTLVEQYYAWVGVDSKGNEVTYEEGMKMPDYDVTFVAEPKDGCTIYTVEVYVDDQLYHTFVCAYYDTVDYKLIGSELLTTDAFKKINLDSDKYVVVDDYKFVTLNAINPTGTVKYVTKDSTGSDVSVEENSVPVQKKYYSVSYYLGDVLYYQEYVAAGEVINLANPVQKTGYSFSGWTGYTEGMIMPESNVTLTAEWSKNSYAVSWDSNGGTAVGTAEDYASGDTIAVPAAPTRDGYTFGGWVLCPVDSAIGVGEPVETQTELMSAYSFNAMTFTAQWYVNGYTVTWDANGGTLADGKTKLAASYEYDAKFNMPEVSVRTGYTFIGWATDANADEKEYADKESVTNLASANGDTVTLYAVWSANQYTVKYNANKGTGNMSESTHTYDVAANLSANTFTRTGYTFIGWATDANADKKEYADNQSVTNLASANGDTVTLYAVWSANQYTVQYNANKGTGNMSESTHTYDVVANLSENQFTRTGYTFIGWATDANADKKEYADNQSVTNLASDTDTVVTLYAVWSANQYTVKYNANKGTGNMYDSKLTYDVAANLSENQFTRTGYTFIGWATDANAYEKEYADKESVTNLASANGDTVTLYAVWSINSYNVTWNVDGKKATESYVYDTAITEKAAPTKDGYRFVRWAGYTSGMKMPANSLEFTAQWKCISTVAINNNPGSKTIKFGETLRLTATVVEIPDGAKLFWYLGDVKVGEGTTCDIKFESGEKTVTVKLVDADGNVITNEKGEEISDSQQVVVNSGFFWVIISFLKNLFGINRIVTQ